MRQLWYIHACTTFGLFVLFPGVFLSSRVTGACPVTTDLIMRVNVRTTTTTTWPRVSTQLQNRKVPPFLGTTNQLAATKYSGLLSGVLSAPYEPHGNREHRRTPLLSGALSE